MDDALAHLSDILTFAKCRNVLILVVMDDALAHNEILQDTNMTFSLNPCCNG